MLLFSSSTDSISSALGSLLAESPGGLTFQVVLLNVSHDSHNQKSCLKIMIRQTFRKSKYRIVSCSKGAY